MSWNHRVLKGVLFGMSLVCYLMVLEMLASLVVKYEVYDVDLGLAARFRGVAGVKYFGSMEGYAFVLTLLPWMLLQGVGMVGAAWRLRVTVEWAFVCFALSLLGACAVCSWLAMSGRDEPLASTGIAPGLWLLGAVGFYALAEGMMGVVGRRRG
ncbi:hypothetical protein [Prosthecobacter fusiformis]|nr:hypothetical protein [Prosthecobacter fusiformis]